MNFDSLVIKLAEEEASQSDRENKSEENVKNEEEHP